MTLDTMTNAEMSKASSEWLSHSGTLDILKSIPRLAALLPKLRLAHQGLAKIDGEPKLDAFQHLVSLASRSDHHHDSKVRGIFHLLTAFSEMAPQESTTPYLALRDALLPLGLETANMSYRDQARSATSVSQRLTPSLAALLKAINLPWGSSLEDEVASWVEAAQNLDAAEDRWNTLKTREQSESQDYASRERQTWIHVTTNLLDALSQESLSPEDRAKLLRNLPAA